jgi:hypothetical protein
MAEDHAKRGTIQAPCIFSLKEAALGEHNHWLPVFPGIVQKQEMTCSLTYTGRIRPNWQKLQEDRFPLNKISNFLTSLTELE